MAWRSVLGNVAVNLQQNVKRAIKEAPKKQEAYRRRELARIRSDIKLERERFRLEKARHELSELREKRNKRYSMGW